MDLQTWLAKEELSPSAFADRLAVTREAVRLWLAGERTPRPEIMREIMKLSEGSVTPNDWILLERQESAK